MACARAKQLTQVDERHHGKLDDIGTEASTVRLEDVSVTRAAAHQPPFALIKLPVLNKLGPHAAQQSKYRTCVVNSSSSVDQAAVGEEGTGCSNSDDAGQKDGGTQFGRQST